MAPETRPLLMTSDWTQPTLAIDWSEERPLALAMDHTKASSLASWRATPTLGRKPSNRHIFLCFQIDQAPKITRELNPFFARPSTRWLARHHHSSKEASSCGRSSYRSAALSNPSQNCLAKKHETANGWSSLLAGHRRGDSPGGPCRAWPTYH
jgi:hypothetical protein